MARLGRQGRSERMEQPMPWFLYSSACVAIVIVCVSISRAHAEDRNTANPGPMTQATSPTVAQMPSIPPLRFGKHSGQGYDRP